MAHFEYLAVFFAFVSVAPGYTVQEEDIPHNEVKNWALKFGVNLWLYGRHITKIKDIRKQYLEAETTFRKKDGVLLTRDLAAEIKNLMDMKRNAIQRILDSAEQAALSQLSDDKRTIRVEKCENLKEIGPHDQPGNEREMLFRKNRHFQWLRVNTTFSCLLFPDGVSNEDDSRIRNDIKWVQELDAIFKNNYEIDPFLGWQYFGTPRGVLYRYPAVKRSDGSFGSNTDEFRLDAWFVEAITSPKDVVILLDTSSSLSESSRHLVRVTAKTILETLGDNDFINIFTFDNGDQTLVACFRDLLVQATNRNKRKLLQAVKTAKSTNEGNITGALTIAFEILHRYNRTGKGSQCNQAIMLIVDDKVSSDFNDIFKQYNQPHKPVRVFTYLIGNGISRETEMKSIACNNKGYYERIERSEEIREKVLNYVLVMARPLVMYENEHPIHWSSARVDGKNDMHIDAEGRLVVTVSAAAFDKRSHTERTADVLGVAAADVSVQEIKKLVPPSKLGVNGYSFLTDNNGHLIYHPELQTPRGHFDSGSLGVDLNDVEFLDTISDWENSTLLSQLRQEMIDQKEGEIDVNLKKHFDSMRRIGFRSYKYFFHPVYDTPFSLSIALPMDYGMYELVAEEEVKLSSANVTDFFRGNNWTVHPDWVYCEYHYPQYKDFSSPEERVLHFVERAIKPAWRWKSLRPRPLDQHMYLGDEPRLREFNSYFCDKNLLQSLIFDAKVTQEFEKPITSFSINKPDHPLATLMALLYSNGSNHFGVTLAFVATRSGLLRWRDYATASEQITKPHFSETNRRTIDEIWYKRAVDHHEIEHEGFVYSVPFNAGGNSNNPQVTATHAIFVENQGYKAPVAVVGVQFQYNKLANDFLNITGACMGGMGCKKTCSSDDLDCYVLDDNGFVIISEKADHAGQFFGEIDGTIMDSLVQDGIYRKVFVYDHQSTCEDTQSPILDGASMLKPFQPIISITNWFLAHTFGLISRLIAYQFMELAGVRNEQWENENPSYSDDYTNDVDEDLPNVDESNNVDFMVEENMVDTIKTRVESSTATSTTSEPDNDKDVPSPPPLYVPSPHKIRKPPTTRNTKVKMCTKKVALFILQAARLNNSGLSNPLKGKLTNCHATGCERPFSVQKIPHSNLMLLVVDTLCPCGSKQLTITPKAVGEDQECDLKHDFMYRRRATKCINYHPEESEIQRCGTGFQEKSSSYLILLSIVLVYISYRR